MASQQQLIILAEAKFGKKATALALKKLREEALGKKSKVNLKKNSRDAFVYLVRQKPKVKKKKISRIPTTEPPETRLGRKNISKQKEEILGGLE